VPLDRLHTVLQDGIFLNTLFFSVSVEGLSNIKKNVMGPGNIYFRRGQKMDLQVYGYVVFHNPAAFPSVLAY
jgi:hypothetical protein